jgi:hypothetical protein
MHKPTKPTTCNVSDLLNTISDFINENPMWDTDPEMAMRMGSAYVMLTKMADPDMTTDDEYEFILNLHAQIKEANNA